MITRDDMAARKRERRDCVGQEVVIKNSAILKEQGEVCEA